MGANSVPPTTAQTTGTSIKDMADQSAALLAQQREMSMQTERSTAATNMEKSRHDAMMAIMSNFKT